MVLDIRYLYRNRLVPSIRTGDRRVGDHVVHVKVANGTEVSGELVGIESV